MSLVDLPWATARQAAYDSGRPLPAERVGLGDALWRTTASAVPARTALPPADTSAMDGWAVAGAGPWRIVGSVRAGSPPSAPLLPGQCVQIATGAVLPTGTVAVLRREDATVTDVDGADGVGAVVSGAVAEGTDIRPAGEECAAGTELVGAGTVLTPIRLGLAAAGGTDVVDVVRRPRVAILILGDELLAAGPAHGGRIRDSLGPQLPGWIGEFGCEVVDLRSVRDRAADHTRALTDALGTADVVVTTGGTAAGPVDFLHLAIAETGGRLVVDGVDCRPGHPMLLAAWADRWLVGLPGNPHAAIAALMTLGQPLTRALRGSPLVELARVRTATRIGGRGTGTRLVPCRLVDGTANPGAHIGSGMLRGLADADGLAVAAGERRAGDLVGWLPLPARD